MNMIGQTNRRTTHANRNRNNEERVKEDTKFYHTTQWKKLRAWHIGQNPLCILCGRPGRVVDHIVPIRLGGDRLAANNLQTMCDYHHNQKRGKESIS